MGILDVLNKDESKKYDSYVDKAEAVIEAFFNREVKIKESYKKGYKDNYNGKDKIAKLPSMSKLRNILSIIMDIYNRVNRENGDEIGVKILEEIDYLRIRIVYECGRDENVKAFTEKSKLRECIKEIGNNKKEFNSFAHYAEALIAYSKYYGASED